MRVKRKRTHVSRQTARLQDFEVHQEGEDDSGQPEQERQHQSDQNIDEKLLAIPVSVQTCCARMTKADRRSVLKKKKVGTKAPENTERRPQRLPMQARTDDQHSNEREEDAENNNHDVLHRETHVAAEMDGYTKGQRSRFSALSLTRSLGWRCVCCQILVVQHAGYCSSEQRHHSHNLHLQHHQ